MKLIIDFDDVIFDTTRFKDYFFKALAIYGITNARKLYEEERKNNKPFSLLSFIGQALDGLDIQQELKKNNVKAHILYGELMNAGAFFINEEMIAIIKKVGRQNCFIVTSGDKDFQNDKITKTKLTDLCQKVYVVPDTKKDIVKELCTFFSSEVVIFIDDKSKFFADVDMKVCKNLKTVLYDDKGLMRLQKAIISAQKIEHAR